MNKKITTRVIRMIALQSALVILTVSMVGAAALVHSEYKNHKAPVKDDVSQSDASDKNETPKPSEVDKTDAPEKNEEDYAYGYAGFYPKTTVMHDDLSKVIVNGSYCLPDDYVPTLAEAVRGSGVMLDSRVAPYYQMMYDAAKEYGITLTPISGYRSVERQKNNFEAKIKEFEADGMDKREATIEAAKIIMIPGSSEHNAGLAMDICSLAESFENTDEFKWLKENAANYGFILRYPKEEEKRNITKVIYEPWHYRFVGVEAAKIITARGITLEEYLGLA